ncbi:MAG TPA: hypothetical protein V6D13_12505 [Halomicronema sp.]
MIYIKNSKLLMTWLISASTTFILATPAESATSISPQISDSAIEVEVINLNEDSKQSSLIANDDQDSDLNQDTDQKAPQA